MDSKWKEYDKMTYLDERDRSWFIKNRWTFSNSKLGKATRLSNLRITSYLDNVGYGISKKDVFLG